MSWYDRDFVTLLPFVEDAFETRDIRQSGDKVFKGLARKLDEVADNPEAVRAIAVMLDNMSPELTGVIVSRTPAAALLGEEFMPPGSVTPEQLPAADPVEPPLADDEEYVYDDSEDDDEDAAPDKPKAVKKKAVKKKK